VLRLPILATNRLQSVSQPHTGLPKAGGHQRLSSRGWIRKNWLEDKERCLKAKIPSEMIKFQTRHELELEMIDNAINEEIPFSYVTMDGFYGENPALLTELENRNITME